MGCITEEAAGRREVVKYLKKISLGRTSSTNTSGKKEPEMRRRNRLFLDDFDNNNDDHDDHDELNDDNDDDDVVSVPSVSVNTDAAGDDEVESGSEDEDNFIEGFEDDSPCSPMNNDEEPRRRSLHSERISIDDSQDLSTNWHSRDHPNPLSYVDTISGKRLDANTRETTPALISESDLGSASAVEPTSEDSDWLINDMPERPTKRRRTNKQATLSSSLALSHRGPSTYSGKNARSKTISNRKASRPKQTRLEVRRTPSPTYFSSSPISHQNANTSFQQGHSSAPSSQGDSAVHQTSSVSTSGGAPPMRIRVQVQGKTFLIPCPEKNDQECKTIAWLAEQVGITFLSD